MASLRDLGLSEYESRAYRALLRNGSTTAKELSRDSDVPMGRVYDVLNDLESQNLVRSQAASRPKKYVAVEPETALDRLLEERKRELESKAEQYEEVVDELLTDLDDAVHPVEEEFWTAAVGPEETLDLLLERLATASDHIVMIADAPSSQFDITTVGDDVVDELESALDRGVSVSVLLTPDLVRTLPESVYNRYADRLVNHSNFEVRTAENVSGTFNVIDQREVCVEVPNPVDPDEVFAMIDLKDAEFAANAYDVVCPRWEQAEPLEG